jgi:hypothetical protein
MPIYVTTRCILNMADSSSEEENECGYWKRLLKEAQDKRWVLSCKI